MTDELVPAEVFETDTMNEARWQEFLAWVDKTAERDDSAEPIELDDVPPSGRWQCITEADAVWAMGRLAHHHAVLDEIGELAEMYRTRVDMWEAKRTKRDAAGAAFLASQLEQWMQRRRAADPKFKSTSFPNGKITTKEVGETVKIEDAAAVVQWAKETGRGGAVQVKESLLVADLKAMGEFVDVIDTTYVRLQCGDETSVEGVAFVGEVCGCRLHPGDLVMIAEVLAHESHREFVDATDDAGAPGRPVPGVRVEPSRIAVTIKPDTVTPDEYA